MGREIICIPVFIILFIILLTGYYVYRYEIHPPIIEFPVKGGDFAFVSMYDGGDRYGASKYKKYKFFRNKKGKWSYIYDKKYTVILYVICALALPVIFLFCSGFSLVWFILKISFFVAVIEALFIFGGPYLLALEPYIVLMRYLKKNKTKIASSEIRKNNKNNKENEKNKNSGTQKDYQYETIEKLIKLFLKMIVSVFWYGIQCLLMIPYVVFVTTLYTMLVGKEILIASAFSVIAILGIVFFAVEWRCLGKNIMGDHSCYVPVSIAGKRKKYDPENLLGKLKGNRNNVIRLKSKQGQVRIYGNGDTHVLEIRTGKKNDIKIFHMIHKDIDSIIPDTDDNPTVIENKWYEKFPVRKNWLVNEEAIGAFLLKLYMSKDIQEAMEGFSFEDNTTEINRLIEEDAYIVPEFPVDWPVGGINSNIGQAWMRKKEERLQRSLKLMEKL